jgi:hypothetical protein
MSTQSVYHRAVWIANERRRSVDHRTDKDPSNIVLVYSWQTVGLLEALPNQRRKHQLRDDVKWIITKVEREGARQRRALQRESRECFSKPTINKGRKVIGGVGALQKHL